MNIDVCKNHPAIKEVARDGRLVQVFKQLEDWTTRMFSGTTHSALLYTFRPGATRLTDFITKYEEITKYFKRHHRSFSEQELNKHSKSLDHLASKFESGLLAINASVRPIQEGYMLSAGDHFFTFDDTFESVPLSKKQNDAIRSICEGLLEFLNGLVKESTGDFQITDDIAEKICGLVGLGSEETFLTYGELVGVHEVPTPQEFFDLADRTRYWMRDGYGEWFNTLLTSLD